MQSRPVRRLALKMGSYAKRHSLKSTAEKFGIVSPTGKPSKGLALQIIQGYEPKRPCTRTRLGLPEKVRFPKPVTVNQLMQLPIQDQPPEILRLALENRMEMKS